MRKIDALSSIVENHLCMGCGTCAAANPNCISMTDTENHGRRPRINDTVSNVELEKIANLCPGRSIPAIPKESTGLTHGYSHAAWGSVLELWEANAKDPEIRYSGSSGGVVSALSLWCIEELGFTGAVQVRASKKQPLLNETVISRNRADVLAATGSRYAPTSPCESLRKLSPDSQYVFTGKPCDVAGAAKLVSYSDSMRHSIGLSISIFCAGTPSINGTRELIQALGIGRNDEIVSVRYRGRGWPGEMTINYRKKGSSEILQRSMSYEKGWGNILQKHTQWRCHLCADHLGEHADLSVGDPWYRPIKEGEAGRSLIVVRTERGRQLLKRALESGILEAVQRPLVVLEQSQPNLERSRGSVFGRRLSMIMTGQVAPRYAGTPLYRVWWHSLTPRQKLQSFAGTIKRILQRRLYQAEQSEPFVE